MFLSSFRISVAAVAAIMCTACATIVGQPTQTIPITSTPSDASILVTDEAGVQVFKGTTPTSVTLQKSTGHYWGKKSFTITISKAGFKDQTVSVTASANGWYIAGNILFGGLIGWFIVDPLNGNMYTLAPDAVNGTLAATAGQNVSSKDGHLSIALLQDVPTALRGQLVQIH